MALRTIKRGANHDYIVARLRRDDRDDLADQVEAKTMSARAAGIAAGILVPPSPLTTLRRVWRRASDEEREAFLAEITAPPRLPNPPSPP